MNPDRLVFAPADHTGHGTLSNITTHDCHHRLVSINGDTEAVVFQASEPIALALAMCTSTALGERWCGSHSVVLFEWLS